MDPVEEIVKLRRRAEEANRRADRNEGALQQLLSQLKEEFGCSNPEEAKREIVRLGKEEAKLVKETEKCLREFEEKWLESLNTASV